jgi:drug/metabolite transporter (DMT)-like permease
VSTPRAAITVPGTGDLVLLSVAVLAISTSAPIIAACTAPALAMAFWRCCWGSGATGAWLALRRPRTGWPFTRAQWRAAVLGGVFLGLHFAAWIPSLRFTSVASSTALVATQPVWAALLARARGAHVPPAAWAGIAVSLSGAVLLTGIDFSLDPRSLIGDFLALLGAVLAAAYVSVGEAARRDLSTGVYTFIGYGAAAVVLAPLAVILGQPLTGFSARDWALIVALTVLAQLLGHTLINRVLGSVSATVTSLAILLELPGAVIIAAVWLGVVPPLSVLPALALILLGLVIVIRSAQLPQPLEDPAG